MRKAYGPSGVSFHYPAKDFIRDVRANRPFLISVGVTEGDFMTQPMDLNKGTDVGLTLLHEKSDSMAINKDGTAVLYIFL